MPMPPTASLPVIPSNEPAAGNCEPRKKAVQRTVSDKKPTRGKAFYRCALWNSGCNFFLWADDADAREGVVSEGKVEQQVRPKQTAETYTLATPRKTPIVAKRKRDVIEDEDFDGFGSDEERQLAQLTDKSVERLKQQGADTLDACHTHNASLEASARPVARTLFSKTEAKRQKTVSFEETDFNPLLTITPSSTQTTHTEDGDATSPINLEASPSTRGLDVTDEVMHLLRGQNVSEEVLQMLQQQLATLVRRTKGIALGRESARAANDEKNARISQLESKIADLEEREKKHKRRVDDMKKTIMEISEEP